VAAAVIAALLLSSRVSIGASSVDTPLPASVTAALDALLACERPDGGWTYVCRQGVRTWGATGIVNTAERLAGPLGLAHWDLVVIRSPGTPAAGELLLRGYLRSRRAEYLAAATRAGDLLVNLQLSSGGWFSEVPVHGARPTLWFRTLVHWTTLDDDATSGPIRLLLALWKETGHARYRAAAERGLDLLLRAQLPSGAWPLTWRLPWMRALSPSFEDLPSLNDAATASVMRAMLIGARLLDRDDLLQAARRAGDWLIRAQAAVPYAGWAQQYDAQGRPAPGRRFELPALASWETRHAVEALIALAAATGDATYCAPIPAALQWLASTAIGPGCWARYYDPGSGEPFFVAADGQRVASLERARRGYAWVGDFGIPALLADFQIAGEDGEPKPLPRYRLAGDSGVCPGERSSEAKIASRLVRPRIAGAGVRLAGSEPPARHPCLEAMAAIRGSHR
jgi:hypothetical protein